MALESRKRNHIFDEEFDRLLQEYTVEHFRDGDRKRNGISKGLTVLVDGEKVFSGNAEKIKIPLDK